MAALVPTQAHLTYDVIQDAMRKSVYNCGWDLVKQWADIPLYYEASVEEGIVRTLIFLENTDCQPLSLMAGRKIMEVIRRWKSEGKYPTEILADLVKPKNFTLTSEAKTFAEKHGIDPIIMKLLISRQSPGIFSSFPAEWNVNSVAGITDPGKLDTIRKLQLFDSTVGRSAEGRLDAVVIPNPGVAPSVIVAPVEEHDSNLIRLQQKISLLEVPPKQKNVEYLELFLEHFEKHSENILLTLA